jgi:hypothetical protein
MPSMLRALGASLFLLLAAAPGIDLRAEAEAVHERVEAPSRERRTAPARAAAAPRAPERPAEARPRTVAEDVGPRTARRTVRPPTVA